MITYLELPSTAKSMKVQLTLVYRGIREQDNCAVVAKVLKQDYPSFGN